MWFKQLVIKNINKDFLILPKKYKGENGPLTFRPGFKCQYWVEGTEIIGGNKYDWLFKKNLFSVFTVHKFKRNKKIVQSNFNQRQKQNPQNFKPLV